MKRLLRIILIISFMASPAFAQDLNKIVFGPLEGDDAGILTVRNGEDIEIEMWVRTDADNPAYIAGVIHPLMSEDYIIAVRNGVEMDPDYAWRAWEVWLDGPYTYNPDDNFPIPEDHTVEIHMGLVTPFDPFPWDFLNTEGEWDRYGSFLMTCNIDIPTENTYYPFSEGWYPDNRQGTEWFFAWPPGGTIVPEQNYCRLYFESETTIDQNENLPLEFSLAQNYPNPFNAATTIKYSLPEESNIAIDIYSTLGRKIETLVSGIQPAGWHSMVWDAENQPSGVYFYRINAEQYMESKSCLLLK